MLPDVKITNHNSQTTSAVTISQCGTFSAVANTFDNNIRLYNLDNLLNKGLTDPMQTFVGHLDCIISIKMSQDSKYIVSGGKDRKVIM